MKRYTIKPRSGWQQKVEEIGFDFHSQESPYWDESVFYEFSMAEVDLLENATNELWQLSIDAVQHVIDNNLYHQFHIPQWFIPHIEKSWNEDAPAIYGRFDFAFKNGVPKLLEFNADTPTSLFESSVVQWQWLQDFDASCDQFNSIHEKLIATWSYLREYLHTGTLHFTTARDSSEDLTTTEYMRDCAIQAGLETKFLFIDEIGWDTTFPRFLDLENIEIRNIFKLYPWEWLVNESFGQNLLKDHTKTFWIEPSWKMILSNKAILPILWKLNHGHKNLLEAYFESDKELAGISFAKKPILSREGANIQLTKQGKVIEETSGEYGEEGFIYQALCTLPDFGNHYPLIGSWIIGQESAGIGIRESDQLITDNTSRFVPHLIK